jgi:excisionase family DNA binding protein
MFAHDDNELMDVRSVSVAEACRLIPAGVTRLYDLINAGEIESYLDGNRRRITLRSIKARRDRLLAAATPEPRRPRTPGTAETAAA